MAPPPNEPFSETYTVGEVARLANVSVRTLHHYDDIGLLSPAGRTDAGYRLYGAADLERLHDILAYRALGFELEAIAEFLARPEADAWAHLRRQEAVLNTRIERLLAMRRSLHKQMEARTMGINLNPKELFEVFGDWDPTEHAGEAEARWGDSSAYQESQRRTRRYGKKDWLRIRAENAAIEAKFAELMAAGVPPRDPRALEQAEAHRQHISRYYYECSYEIHRGVGEMYVADPRFTAYYEGKAEGLAAYVAAAVVANSEGRQEGA
ncbi:MAG: MerR family transcriptional regulator [Truepera sp.]|nr:MerR family transcriptional regulator [Truepera sp.]